MRYQFSARWNDNSRMHWPEKVLGEPRQKPKVSLRRIERGLARETNHRTGSNQGVLIQRPDTLAIRVPGAGRRVRTGVLSLSESYAPTRCRVVEGWGTSPSRFAQRMPLLAGTWRTRGREAGSLLLLFERDMTGRSPHGIEDFIANLCTPLANSCAFSVWRRVEYSYAFMRLFLASPMRFSYAALNQYNCPFRLSVVDIYAVLV